MLEFDSIQNALEKLQAVTDASEAHGTLCGLLLGQQDLSKWLKFTLESIPEQGDLLAVENLRLLQELFDLSKQQLNADDMSMELLLPDDAEEFAIRLLGLATWCQGFLYGLAVNGEALVSGLSEQGRECLEDLLEISQLGHDEEETDETEAVYAEIVEHVRLSVIYMNEEINPLLPSPSLQ
ncbi:MAG: UPF0149 family protein [Gammaproteobacteria bacterium]|jgi:hypothetical protein|nr:UPF0149 family protein [Gammaproteobacteria bacterium]MBT3724393.1 UPF0149 family protein [Gammaproteobacteria bacterium]MBT4076424.1 UPF0149 family protein [Gammaproteobacteria bacterium]MBT4194086.1 UPF0149 family protein [Gammaproteobacteria bacterium]MBT4451398.1 UPF0149 family protein [Gammaproteobacteria bacterium]